jgi:protein-tyrosine phosphatase
LGLPELHWLTWQWPGRVALAARPRGRDWLPDEIAGWKRSGVSAILSLLTSDEERDLDLIEEATEARKQGLEFDSFPIEDRRVPVSEVGFRKMLEKLNGDLSAGRNVLIHCRQGVGRTGLVAACLLIKNGMSPGAAVESVSASRGVLVPETMEQRDWIERFAPALTK